MGQPTRTPTPSPCHQQQHQQQQQQQHPRTDDAARRKRQQQRRCNSLPAPARPGSPLGLTRNKSKIMHSKKKYVVHTSASVVPRRSLSLTSRTGKSHGVDRAHGHHTYTHTHTHAHAHAHAQQHQSPGPRNPRSGAGAGLKALIVRVEHVRYNEKHGYEYEAKEYGYSCYEDEKDSIDSTADAVEKKQEIEKEEEKEDDDDAYNSDEDDRRNGCRITYAPDKGEAFSCAVARRAEAEFAYFSSSSALLQTLLAEREVAYAARRREFFDGVAARTWSVTAWSDFVSMDELLAALRGELFAAQERMEHRAALMLLFLNAGLPAPGQGVWAVQNGIMVWSLNGGAEEFRDCGKERGGDGALVLEWKGVDYNSPMGNGDDNHDENGLRSKEGKGKGKGEDDGF
ncbi:hypothetical protein GGR50DRAFT_672514 [Xylaria sp. CBS 124048]|nr:hypothetical protein GGR50DRAFT_672514 [Xylaria sp. CBS 124048]